MIIYMINIEMRKIKLSLSTLLVVANALFVLSDVLLGNEVLESTKSMIYCNLKII